jgi:hypothetical protein
VWATVYDHVGRTLVARRHTERCMVGAARARILASPPGREPGRSEIAARSGGESGQRVEGSAAGPRSGRLLRESEKTSPRLALRVVQDSAHLRHP